MIASPPLVPPDPPLRAMVEAAWEDLRSIVRREIGARGAGGEAHVSSVLGDAMLRVLSQREAIVDGSQLRGLTTLFARRILIDRRRRARRYRRVLRNATAARDPYAAGDGRGADLADALDSLRRHDERKFMAITLSAMDRLPQDMIAAVLGTSLATVERDLRFSRAWIAARLGRSGAGTP